MSALIRSKDDLIIKGGTVLKARNKSMSLKRSQSEIGISSLNDGHVPISAKINFQPFADHCAVCSKLTIYRYIVFVVSFHVNFFFCIDDPL